MPQKCVSGRGSAPDPAGPLDSAPPYPLAGFEGATSRAYAYKSAGLLYGPWQSLNLILTNGQEPWIQYNSKYLRHQIQWERDTEYYSQAAW